MTPPSTTPSARETELLDLSYAWVLAHGLSDLSLRPLAAAIGSSPRVLLFLFGSKEELLRRLLARTREDELAWLGAHEPTARGLVGTLVETWTWLSAPTHDALLRIWVEAYARSLVEPSGPWGDFARTTVEDWLGLLARAQPVGERRTARGRNRRTLALAVLRGALLDLLATGDRDRVGAAVRVAAAELKLPG